VTNFDALRHEQQLGILLDVARSATANYDLPANLTVSLINLSENATYRIEAADGRCWAMRVHRDGYHSRTAIASELAWLTALRQAGVVITPVPVKGKDGELIQLVGHAALPRPRHVVLSEWEPGAEPGIGEQLSGPFEVLGEMAARMHIHARQWRRPSWFCRHSWDFETSLGEERPHWGRWRDGMGVDAAKARLFARTVELIGKRLAAFGQEPERFGLIHCDLRLSNLLIDGPTVKVLDFDDSGFGWYMYDAATPISFYEHEPHVGNLIESWKTGYRRVLDLPKADEAEIPTFVMLRRLLLVAWIGSHSETDLAKSLGLPYTEGTVGLCEDYLKKFA
jgi:Ser/Thr protein kinase RdoA (MazF antagonist)